MPQLGTEFHPLRVPVGAYGADAARALAVAAVGLVNALETRGHRPLDEAESGLVGYHTYFGRTQKYGDKSFLTNEQQGIAFVVHAIGATASERVPGYRSFPELLEGLSREYTIETMTKLVGSRTVTPLNEKGRYVEHSLTSRLRISPELTAYAALTRARHRQKAGEDRTEHDRQYTNSSSAARNPATVDPVKLRELHQTGALGLSCPVSDRGGAITVTTRLLAKLVGDLLA